MKTKLICKYLLVILLCSVLAGAQTDQPTQQDHSYTAIPEVSKDGNSFRQADNGYVTDDTETGTSTESAANIVVGESEGSKKYVMTDFVAQVDNDVFEGSKKGQSYHVCEDGQIEPVITMEDRSSWEMGKIHPDVSQMALEQDQVKVIIHLKDKPLGQLSKNVKANHLPQINALAQQVKDIIAQQRPKKNFANPEQEKHSLADMVLPQDRMEIIKSTNKQIDSLLDAMRKDISQQTKQAVAGQQKQIFNIIDHYKGQVTGVSSLSNSIGAVIPASVLEVLARSPLVESITPDYQYTFDLDESASMLGASAWWDAGYDGGIYDAALIDGGVREDHVYLKYRTPPSSNPRDIFKKTAGYSGSHGTRTAGVIASTHPTYKGIAFGLDALFEARGHNDISESDVMENVDWVLDCPLTTQGPEVINNSYSLYYLDYEYGPYERFMDAVVDDLWVMVTKSAGNRGTEKIGYPQSHNLMSAANLDIKDTSTTTDDIITSSSSRGPTPSGRRKPDICAPGTNTYSTDIASTTAFANHGGTSAAAPHVAGAIVLLEDGGNNNPMAQKAVLINTATTWSDGGTLTEYGDDGPIGGDHWDPSYGWGVMDLDHAFFHRNDYFVFSVTASDDAPDDDDYKFYKGYMDANDKATLVWHRRAVYNGDSEPSTYYTLTDLNLRLYDEDTGYLIDSDTIHQSNNVHQVSCDDSRDVVIKAYCWSSSIDGASSEDFALATEENFERADPPTFSITLSMPSVIYFSTNFTVSARVYNNGDVAAHNNQITLNLPAGFTLVSGSNPRSLGKINPGFSSLASWTVRSPGSSGNFSISVTNSSTCYLETYTATKSASIEVGLAGLPNLTYTTPSGWDYPIVPRSAGGATNTWCPVTTTLPGNTDDTYYNWAWINDSAVSAASHYTAVYMDGVWFFSSTVSLGPGAVMQHRNIQKPQILKGGRHTLYYVLDEDDDVTEQHEGDNRWGNQFVWSPYALSDNSPVTRSAPPARDAWGDTGGALWYNNDGFSFDVQNVHPDKWWSAVGILPADANSYYSLRLWDIGDYTGSEGGFGSGYLEWSIDPYDSSDFVIVNDNMAAAGTYYAGAINDNNATGGFRIEESASTKIYPRPGTQWNGPYSKNTTNVLDIYEIYLTAGEYFFYLDQTVGTCDLGMSLYDDETINAKKSEYITGAFAENGGDGADEKFQVKIADAGYHGLVIWKSDSSDYAKSHSYRIAVGPPTCTVTAPNGGETLIVGQLYTITWDNFGNLSHNVKIEISRDSGNTWSTIIASTANDGNQKWSVGLPGSTKCRIRITSTSDASYTDSSDADFTIDSSGIPPEINVREDLTDIPYKGSYDFGNVNLGYDKSVTFTIENLGGADLNLTGVPPVKTGGVDAGHFVVTSQPSTPVLSMDSTTFNIKFTPDVARSYTATITIANNDTDESLYTFKVTATGTLPQTFYVDDNAPNDPGPFDSTISDPNENGSQTHPFDMIQEAIDRAFHHQDSIIVLPGNYYENIDLEGKSVLLTSTDPQDPAIVATTVINALGKGSVVTFASGEDADCVLNGFKITGGAGYEVEFAGIDVWAGGGIQCIDSSPTIKNCVISYNSAELGGGIYGSNSDMVVSNCQILRNSASNFHGGGIYICDGSKPQLTNNIINRNTAVSSGGGFASQSGAAARITTSKVFGNTAASGGGLYIANSSSTVLSKSLVYKNISKGTSSSGYYNGGGAMALWGAPVLCENCLFYGNEAAVEGGAIQCAYTSGVLLKNCIFWENTAPDGFHIYLRYKQGSTSYPSTMAASYSDWEGGKTGVTVDAGCTFTWGTGNFDDDPLFADVARDDYHLRSEYGRWDPVGRRWVTTDTVTSPCIDAGDPASDWKAELWPNGKRINVEAYGGTCEASMSPSKVGNIADLNVDGKVDFLDLKILSDGWLLDDLLLRENMDRQGFVDLHDYSIFGNNWKWTEP